MKGYLQGGSSKERSAISRNPSLTKSNPRDVTGGYPHPTKSQQQQQSSIPSSNRNSSHIIYQSQQTPISSKITESPFTHNNTRMPQQQYSQQQQQQLHASALTSGNTTMRNRQERQQQPPQPGQHGVVGSTGISSRAESNNPGQRSPFLLNQNNSTNRGGPSINSNTSSRKQTPEKTGKQTGVSHQSVKNEPSYTKYLRELDNYENLAHPNTNNHQQQQQSKRKSDKQQQSHQFMNEDPIQKKTMKINLIRNAYDRRNTHVNPSLDTSDVPFAQLKNYMGREGGNPYNNNAANGQDVNDNHNHSHFLGNPIFQQFSNFSTDLKHSTDLQSSSHKNTSQQQQQQQQLDSYSSNQNNSHSKYHQIGANYGRSMGGVSTQQHDTQNYSLDRGYNTRNNSGHTTATAAAIAANNNSQNQTQFIDISIASKMKVNSHSGSANPQTYMVPAGRLGQQSNQQGSKLKGQTTGTPAVMHSNNNSTHFSRIESVFDDSFSEGQIQRMQYEGLLLNERRASLEMNKMLSSHPEIVTSTTRVNLNDRSFDAGLDTTQNHIRTLSKVSTYASAQISQAVSMEVAQLIEIGQKYFKENNLSEAIKNFQSAAKLDNSNLELNYLLGVCYLGKNEYQNSVKEFLSVIEKNPNCRKNVYLLISIAFKKLDNIPGAIRMLTKVIQNHPQYYDAFIYRGKLLIKEKSWEKAQLDFDSAIRIQPDKGLAYLGKADCLQSMNKFSEAVEVYTKAMKTENSIVVNALLKRAIALIADKRYDEALVDLAKVIQAEENNSEAYYFKGIAHYKQRNLSEASLSFEQSVKFNKSKKSVTKSLYEIARIKIEQRDFYQAYHTLSRSDYLDTDKKELEKFRLFTEGVIFLMKRKFKEAIDNFNLITQNFTLGDFLKPLFYVYRAYGYFCLGKHQLALYDYLACDSASSTQVVGTNSSMHSNAKGDDVSSQYNKSLVEGILATTSGNFEAGITSFNAAQKLFSSKMEPAFYRALNYITKEFSKANGNNNNNNNNTNSNSESAGQSRSSDFIKIALREMDKAIEISDANANLFYLRAVVLCYLGQFDSALSDIDKAITKSEDNEAKYFYLRGHSFSCCKQYKQAISDFSFAIQIDEKFADAFLERSKCYHFVDESNNAFADLQKYISLRPSDPNIHLLAGNLLFNKGEYKDAIRAYSHSDLIETSPNLLLLRAQCSVVLFNLPAALKDINTILSQQASKSLSFDKVCISGILNVLDAGKSEIQKQQSSFKSGLEKIVKAESGFAHEQTGRIFDKSDFHVYKGILEFYTGNYEDALRSFSSALTTFAAQQPHNIGGDVVILFNLALTQAILKKYRDAYETCIRLSNIVEDASSPKSCFSLLLKILYHEKESKQLKNESSSEEEMKAILLQGIVQENVEARLSEGLPYFPLNLSTVSGAKMRLMLPLPLIMPPDLHPVFQKSLIENIDVTMVENKPEAPWIRRNATGVIFTDNIQVFEHLDLETEENQKSSGEDERQIKIDRLKAKLMLDKDIENKLKNIKNGPKKQKANEATTTTQDK